MNLYRWESISKKSFIYIWKQIYKEVKYDIFLLRFHKNTIGKKMYSLVYEFYIFKSTETIWMKSWKSIEIKSSYVCHISPKIRTSKIRDNNLYFSSRFTNSHEFVYHGIEVLNVFHYHTTIYFIESIVRKRIRKLFKIKNLIYSLSRYNINIYISWFDVFSTSEIKFCHHCKLHIAEIKIKDKKIISLKFLYISFVR